MSGRKQLDNSHFLCGALLLPAGRRRDAKDAFHIGLDAVGTRVASEARLEGIVLRTQPGRTYHT